MMSIDTEKHYVRYSEALAYGFAAGGKSFVTTPTQSGYLSLFFTKVFGLPAGAVSFMMLLSPAVRCSDGAAFRRSVVYERCKLCRHQNCLYVCFIYPLGALLYLRGCAVQRYDNRGFAASAGPDKGHFVFDLYQRHCGRRVTDTFALTDGRVRKRRVECRS